jgi:diacylglycerol kinase family enzyme
LSKVGVILNATSGPGGMDAMTLLGVFRAEGMHAEIRCIDKDSRADDLARQMLDEGFTTIIAAGGDGTVSAVASVLAGTDLTLGILPFGTFNHLAKDLRIPIDIAEAVRVIRSGKVIQIDAGEVNERLFLNNVSLGVYPAFVEARGEARRGAKFVRWARRLWAALRVFRHVPRLWVRVNVDGRQFSRLTPAILIGNNEYRVDSPLAGTRERLDAGRLCLILTRQRGGYGLLMQALRASVGRLRGSHDLDELSGHEITLRLTSRSVHVGVDGEIVRMRTPLVCRVRARAIRVIVPEGS